MISQNARINMIKQQLRTGDVLNENILALYDKFPRDEFVPRAMQRFAYSDMQIPLDHDQRMMTPLEEGLILGALNLQKNEVILEVGTGTGYFTALLSSLAQKVISIDYFQDFTNMAAGNLKKHHCNNVELITGDACNGWLDKAPYDVIVMTGAIDSITDTLRLQILPGGRIFAIIGKEPVMQAMLFTLGLDGRWTEELIFETCIPPLINKLKPKEFIF
ncbi:protein-L-isoaspartate-O-methyltransferase [Legionella beliardensis]|uniref:Protein-L-isoaspartate O-methyltransferase n=1 Tax=Legionella beliardensis TaxID=91822 RepID=A0A378I476_9GAMM|nr:protein-L-isoaspartate O-methyltransferase [Legionella beliardensis]STX29560.1 protein-L-isoaspartate-O-methyltransferase [Legionella beliardensis]